MNKSMKDLVADARSRVDGIAPADAHRAMAQGDVILDVRETAELKSDGAIEGAIHIPRGLVEAQADPETGKALAPGGRFVLYGPFLRNGETTSDGDARFHASLRAADPEVGYKDDFDIVDWLHAAGLTLVEVVEMPANNLAFVSERVTET